MKVAGPVGPHIYSYEVKVFGLGTPIYGQCREGANELTSEPFQIPFHKDVLDDLKNQTLRQTGCPLKSCKSRGLSERTIILIPMFFLPSYLQGIHAFPP